MKGTGSDSGTDKNFEVEATSTEIVNNLVVEEEEQPIGEGHLDSNGVCDNILSVYEDGKETYVIFRSVLGGLDGLTLGTYYFNRTKDGIWQEPIELLDIDTIKNGRARI